MSSVQTAAGPNLRRAALILQALGPEVAQRIARQLSPQQRRLLEALGGPPVESSPAAARQSALDSLVRVRPPSFDFVQSVPVSLVAATLAAEPPVVAAVVLTYLPAAPACQVLEALPEDVRLAVLQACDLPIRPAPGVIRCVCATLREYLLGRSEQSGNPNPEQSWPGPTAPGSQ